MRKFALLAVLVWTALCSRSGAADDRLVTEGIVEAPISEVWAAWTTNKGLESWSVAHAEIDLKVGGKMLTHYDPKGTIGDDDTIENTILCFDPERMFAIKATRPPAKFPFKEAIKSVWTVVYLEEVQPKKTRVRVVSLGYGSDDESKKLRAFFEKGNAYSLQKLQEKFGPKQEK